MKKPVNKSYQRGHRNGFIKGFFVAVAMMIILTVCVSSANAQQYSLSHISGETELFQDESGANTSNLEISIISEGCLSIVSVSHGSETSEFTINDHYDDQLNGLETICASGLIMQYDRVNGTVMLFFETLDMQGYGEAIYKLKV